MTTVKNANDLLRTARTSSPSRPWIGGGSKGNNLHLWIPKMFISIPKTKIVGHLKNICHNSDPKHSQTQPHIQWRSWSRSSSSCSWSCPSPPSSSWWWCSGSRKTTLTTQCAGPGTGKMVFTVLSMLTTTSGEAKIHHLLFGWLTPSSSGLLEVPLFPGRPTLVGWSRMASSSAPCLASDRSSFPSKNKVLLFTQKSPAIDNYQNKVPPFYKSRENNCYTICILTIGCPKNSNIN